MLKCQSSKIQRVVQKSGTVDKQSHIIELWKFVKNYVINIYLLLSTNLLHEGQGIKWRERSHGNFTWRKKHNLYIFLMNWELERSYAFHTFVSFMVPIMYHHVPVMSQLHTIQNFHSAVHNGYPLDTSLHV